MTNKMTINLTLNGQYNKSENFKMNPHPVIVNPYAKRATSVATSAGQEENSVAQEREEDSTMTGQSQARKSQTQRLFANARRSRPRQLADALDGKGIVCRRCNEGPSYKKGHHPDCTTNPWFNKHQKANNPMEQYLEANNKPLSDSEKCSFRPTPQVLAEFTSGITYRQQRDAVQAKRAPLGTVAGPDVPPVDVDSEVAQSAKPKPQLSCIVETSEICEYVANNWQNFQKDKNNAPAAITAWAHFVQKTCLQPENPPSRFSSLFSDGMSMTMPAVHGHPCPHVHSLSGQTLLIVDWQRPFPDLVLKCPNCCHALKRDRTNMSKNQNLFPIFGLGGPPTWAAVMNYDCLGLEGGCGARFAANDGELLATFPEFVANLYPVDVTFCRGTCHLDKTASNLLKQVILTYGSGELFSRLLYDAINKSYEDKITNYLSYHLQFPSEKVATDYIPKDGTFVTRYPPQGDTIRRLYEDSMSCNWNAWRMSDKERWKREMQNVVSRFSFAQDHTFEAIKNYHSTDATAIWDVATETGEIACAVLVRTTETVEFAHAAEQLSRREGFQPKVKYSDTWPNMDVFWLELFGEDFDGRLGLFHYIQRISRTLRKSHQDFGKAINKLLKCIYTYHDVDLANLIKALMAGTLGDYKWSEREVSEKLYTKEFRNKYQKYLRKIIRSKETIIIRLENWHVEFKCTASPGKPAARGRKDPVSNLPLFTSDTRKAVFNAKKNAGEIQDPLPIDEMYVAIPTTAEHGLTEWICKRPESKLENAHDPMAHYGNGGMRNSLADTLNLAGTAGRNLSIRHKLRLHSKHCSNLPAGWEKAVSHDNHTRLHHINNMAIKLTLVKLPFDDVEPPLRPDNGEVFFSEYFDQQELRREKYSAIPHSHRCPCTLCFQNPAPLPHCADQLRVPVNVDQEKDEELQQQQQQQVRSTTAQQQIGSNTAQQQVGSPCADDQSTSEYSAFLESNVAAENSPSECRTHTPTVTAAISNCDSDNSVPACVGDVVAGNTSTENGPHSPAVTAAISTCDSDKSESPCVGDVVAVNSPTENSTGIQTNTNNPPCNNNRSHIVTCVNAAAEQTNDVGVTEVPPTLSNNASTPNNGYLPQFGLPPIQQFYYHHGGHLGMVYFAQPPPIQPSRKRKRNSQAFCPYHCGAFLRWQQNPERNGRPPHDSCCPKHPKNSIKQL
jgi:hypothetical protein